DPPFESRADLGGAPPSRRTSGGGIHRRGEFGPGPPHGHGGRGEGGGAHRAPRPRRTGAAPADRRPSGTSRPTLRDGTQQPLHDRRRASAATVRRREKPQPERLVGRKRSGKPLQH